MVNVVFINGSLKVNVSFWLFLFSSNRVIIPQKITNRGLHKTHQQATGGPWIGNFYVILIFKDLSDG
jgi:hypothetical protein